MRLDPTIIRLKLKIIKKEEEIKNEDGFECCNDIVTVRISRCRNFICGLCFCSNRRNSDNISMFYGVNLIFRLCSKSLLCKNTLQLLRVVKKERVIPSFLFSTYGKIYVYLFDVMEKTKG